MSSRFRKNNIIESDSDNSTDSGDNGNTIGDSDLEDRDIDSDNYSESIENSSDPDSDDDQGAENVNEKESVNEPFKHEDLLKEDSFEHFIKDKYNGVTSTPHEERKYDADNLDEIVQYGNEKTIFESSESNTPEKDLTDISSDEIDCSSNGAAHHAEKEKNSLEENDVQVIKSFVESSSNKILVSQSDASTFGDSSVIDDSLTNTSHFQFSKIVISESSAENISSELKENSSGDSEGSSVEFITSVTKNNFQEPPADVGSITTSSCNETSGSIDQRFQVFQINDSDSNDLNSSLQVSGGSTHLGPSLINGSVSDDSQNTSQKSVQSFESERQLLERQIADKSAAYHNLMRALRSCDTRKLKDGGKLLQEKMEKCEEELHELKEKLKSMGNDNHLPEVVKPKIEINSIFSTKDQIISNLGKKGLETHRVQAALTVDTLVRIHESLLTCPGDNVFEKDPDGLKVSLMPHQKHALAWLLWREKQTPSGGILADDMGLGKTLSILSLVLKSEENKNRNENEEEEDRGSTEIVNGIRTYKGSTLIVCPASLLGQWEGQIKQHCKRNALTSVIHHGKTREYQAKRLAAYDVVITTYGLMAEENKCQDKRKGILFRVRWERVVLDEAHIIRNHKTQKAVAACELTANYRWCLTGTPVHNRELDMYSLLKFLRCAPFDDRVVWKRWVDNKTANGVQRLKTVIKSLVLRRTKEDLKQQGELSDLPNKEVVPVYIELDEEELKVYHKVLHFSKSLLAEYLHQRNIHAGASSEKIESVRRQLKSVDEIKTTEIFVLLLRLRQICCLPGLIHSFLEKETCIESGIEPENPVIEDLYTQLSRMSIGSAKPILDVVDNQKERNVLVKSNPVFQINRQSTKISTLLKIIKDILATDDKIVIVSQWTNLLKKLESHIQTLKVGIVTLDGSVPVKFRSKIIDDFNCPGNDVRIMLLSLNAGGVGLNLVGGNRLIVFEPHWNPQLESQACDRVHRVGQKKQVYIYKIICKNTIEERIELLQRKKLELAQNILQGVNSGYKSQVSQLSLPDLINLFDVDYASART